MGQDKGLVEIAGRPMIDYVIEQVSDLADDVLITTNNINNYIQFGLRMVTDKEPGAGALHGLQTALSHAMGSLAIVVACDMPFINRGLLEYQIEKAFETGADVVVPEWDGRYQTMHAVYKREACLAAVEKAIGAGQAKMTSFYGDLNIVTIGQSEISKYSPTGNSFRNINTPADLEEAEQLFILS